MPQFPRTRIVSTATAITVNSSTTALSTAAAGMTSGQFLPFSQPSLWTRTQDPREPTANESIAGPNYRWSSPMEQGDTGHGIDYTIIDWGGKICYDPIGKKVMFAGNGANPGGTTVRGYSFQYNKHSVYDEATNTWTQYRGIKGSNEGADPDCIVHLLGNHCIDVVGRRFFKKKFRESPGRILVNNLTTNEWTMIEMSGVNEVGYNRAGGLEFVPGRIGGTGRLWGALTNTSGFLTLYEIDPDTGAGYVLVSASSLGNQDTNEGYGMPCVYNPRAFGGAGGVLTGRFQARKLTVPTPTGTPDVYDAGTPIVAMSAATGHRVCRDPVGDGWYHFVSGTFGNGKIYRTAGNLGSSAWVEAAVMPLTMCNAPNLILCPIDEYGVIWCLTSYLGYASPVTWTGGQNNSQAWLWKP